MIEIVFVLFNKCFQQMFEGNWCELQMSRRYKERQEVSS